MIPTTRIAWLSRIQDGMLFQEDFEAANFVDNERWLTLQGLAEHTKDEAVAGKYSLRLADTQDDSNLPVIIKEDITDLSPVSFFADDQNREMTVWYFDDMNHALEGPFMKVEMRNSRFFEVGVRNSIDTNYYSVTGNPAVEDDFVASSIGRTPGWHKLQVQNTGTGGPSASFDIKIDDVVAASYSIPLSSLQMFFVSLQAAIAGHQTDSFGNFDELRYQRGSTFKILGVNGRRIEISGGIGTTDNNLSTSSDSFTAAVLPDPNLYDINISQKIVDNSVTANYTALSIAKKSVNFQNGDIWLIQEIDFGRKAYPFQDNPTTNGANSESPNGSTETLTVGRKEKIQFSIKALEGLNWFRNAQNFFDYSRKGGPFSFALDSNNTAFTTLAGAQFPGDAFIFVDPVLSDTNAGIRIGQYYAIEDVNRTQRQVVMVTAYGGSSGEILIDQPLDFAVAVGDYVRAINYWPYTETEVPRVNGLILVEARTLRYDWNFLFREYVP